MMNRARKLISILGLAILAIGVVLVFRPNAMHEEKKVGIVEQVEQSDSKTSRATNPEQTNNGETLSAHPQESELEVLLNGVNAGDLVSINKLRRTVNGCISIRGHETDLIEAQQAVGMPAFYMNSLKRDIKRCEELAAYHDAEALAEELDAALAEANPVQIKAESLVDILDEEGIERADQVAAEVLLSSDGYAIHQLGSYFSYVDSVFPVNSTEQVRARNARNNAIDLLACENGWPQCRQGSETMLNICAAINSEPCFRNLDFFGYSQTFVWSPAELNDALEAKGEFELMISNGEVREILKLGRD